MTQKKYIFTYKGNPIPYFVYKTGDGSEVENIVFLGSAQINEIPKWVAEYCPPNTVVVQGAPHWLADSQGMDTTEFMYKYVENALEQVLDNFKVHSLNVVGESQATPALVSLFTTDRFKILAKYIVLIQPLGLTSNLYNKTRDENIRSFKRRVLINTKSQLSSAITDKRYRHNFKIVKNRIDFKDEQIIEQYNIGLAHNAVSDLGKLYEINKNVFIISGSKDAVFPVKEIQRQLKLNDIDIEVVTIRGVAHASLASRLGRKLLAKAFEVVTSHT